MACRGNGELGSLSRRLAPGSDLADGLLGEVEGSEKPVEESEDLAEVVVVVPETSEMEGQSS